MQAISWEKFRDYVDAGMAAVCPIGGKHLLSLVVWPRAQTIGLRIPYGGALDLDMIPYAELRCTIVMVKDVRAIELSTSAPTLFHSFYLFAYAVADLIESHDRAPPQAIREALEHFGLLLNERSLLPETTRLGLVGELCFLEALLKAHGPGIVEAWLGPVPQRHDFRLGNNEFEVKTTLSNKRLHTIHGLSQLEPSPGKSLYLISLHLERAGPQAGETLPMKVVSVRELLGSPSDYFERNLKKLGYKQMDEAFYTERYQLRSSPTLIRVDSNCPRITEAIVSPMLPTELLHRLDTISYDIDVEGLGVAQGSSEYADVVPVALAMEKS